MSSELGVTWLGDGRCRFLVWAPKVQTVEVRVGARQPQTAPMQRLDRGYHEAVVEGVDPDSLYRYRLNGVVERPDPASRFQPQGVHGPSQVVDHGSFAWGDSGWSGLPLEKYILYELHVGAFTPEGTFDAVIPHLDNLRDLGMTAVELMPVAQFPGSRNWGYDAVYPFAVQASYGGPEGLKRLVNACHERGLAVVLDAVYNHLGPEGNYLGEFAPYFTDRYASPWGQAINFDGPESDEVVRFFVDNALEWLTDFHVDALRLDAINSIFDLSARPFLAELSHAVRSLGERLDRRVYLIAESDMNDVRVIRPPQLGGYGLDAQWNDDFHRALHALLTGERQGYYCDFGSVERLAKAFREGFVLSGQYSAYRKCRHGNSSRLIPAYRFVVYAQNHDQVGNRMLGERLSRLVSFEELKLAAGVTLLSPFIPLVFMGEEYGETAPFQYFVDHSDPALAEAVRRGRREEFADFGWRGDATDPGDEATFRRSRLDHTLASQGTHRVLRELYQDLIALRRELPCLARLSKESMEVAELRSESALLIRRWNDSDSGLGEALMMFNFGKSAVSLAAPVPAGQWQKRFDSAHARWQGSGSAVPESLHSEGVAIIPVEPKAFVVFTRF
ncbi:MAG: malto-oligosyltrehalose trehalohydrolase [Acidobacteria bacterium]|nr:MAG: malto-oligosyltrehalose trehalohydrolase [Acidobacteriota bacterium]